MFLNTQSKTQKNIKKCKWSTKKGKNCTFKALTNTTCCKRHQEWEEISPDNPDLKRCPSCRNLFLTKETKKTCDKCKKRGIINQKKERIKKHENSKKCIGFVSKTKEPCKHYALKDDDYCGDHQKLKKYIILSKNNKVCTNWIRGCFNILEENDKSSCKDCKKRESEKDKKRRNLRKEKALSHNSVIKEDLMCILCNSICKTSEATNSKCIKCYNIYINGQASRKPREKYNSRLREYKNRAKNKKNQEWTLTDGEAIALFKKPCHYCDTHKNQMSGIDRKDNNLGYTPENSLPCCTLCNMMKFTYSYDNFYKIINVISHNYVGNPKYNIQYINIMNELFECAATELTYETYINNSCKKRNIIMNLAREEYFYLKNLKCQYCGNFGGTGRCGIDRTNSKLDYTLDNCVPCCKTCNFLKKDLTLEKFTKHLNKIYKFNEEYNEEEEKMNL